jgi:hypothetical protein
VIGVFLLIVIVAGPVVTVWQSIRWIVQARAAGAVDVARARLAFSVSAMVIFILCLVAAFILPFGPLDLALFAVCVLVPVILGMIFGERTRIPASTIPKDGR